ncbi:hypothetical protein U1Q18_011748 [Sarracenia purpurea var. burkii]
MVTPSKVICKPNTRVTGAYSSPNALEDTQTQGCQGVVTSVGCGEISKLIAEHSRADIENDSLDKGSSDFLQTYGMIKSKRLPKADLHQYGDNQQVTKSSKKRR